MTNMHMSLENMRMIDIRTIDTNNVIDANDINIDANLPMPERVTSYIRQTNNPYVMRVGKIIVKMSFSETTMSVNDCMKRYLKTS